MEWAHVFQPKAVPKISRKKFENSIDLKTITWYYK